MSAFSKIFLPVEKAELIQRFFNQEPLLIQGQGKDFSELLNERQFYRCLRKSENVRAVFAGMYQASIAPNDARDMFEAGATICATGIDRAHPPLWDLAQELREELGYSGPVTVNSYHSPSGAGFDHHFDPRVVTVVQISGVKKWGYCPVPYEAWPLNRPYSDSKSREETLKLHVERNGTVIVDLKPGDVLCLPAGCIHWAEAASGSTLSLNVAFDYIGHGMADLVAAFIRNKLLTIPEMRHPAFKQHESRARLLARQAADVIVQLADQIRSAPDEALGLGERDV